jgi:hypothetical protein
MYERRENIETERLFLQCLMPEEIESIISGDFEHVSLLTGAVSRQTIRGCVLIGLGI